MLSGSLKQLTYLQILDYWPAYLAGMVTLICTHYLQSFLPFWAKEIADATQGAAEVYWPKFVYIALGIIFFRTTSRLLFFNPARYLQLNMRNAILHKIENTFPDRYTKYSSGQIYQILFSDIDNIRGIVGFAVMQMINGIIAFAILVPRIIAFNSKLLFAFAPMFVFFFVFVFLMMRLRVYFQKGQEYQGDIQNYLMEAFDAKKTIKNFNAEKAFERRFSYYSQRELDIIFQGGIRMSSLMPIVPLGIGLSFALGVYYIHAANMGVSTIILFSGFSFLFIGPLSFLMWVGGVITRGQASWDRLQNLLKDLDLVTTLEVELNESNREVNSSTTYKVTIPFWQKKIKFSFAKNSWTVIVGETGVGKSEALKRLAMVLKQHNKKISYVAQSPYLYNDTIQNNIFMGKIPAAYEINRAKKLLTLMGLDHISGSKDLMMLEVGENGKRLSGGQVKRVALVRSIMTGPELILWDDPFSSVDLILEKEILNLLKEDSAIRQITFLLTSHRLSTVRYCDELIYLSKEIGVKERGTITNLLTNQESLSYAYFKDQLV